MKVCELWDDLTGDHETIWFFKTTTPHGVDVLLLLDENGDELARRYGSNNLDSWTLTNWSRPPRFSMLPDGAAPVDMVDEEEACFNLMILEG